MTLLRSRKRKSKGKEKVKEDVKEVKKEVEKEVQKSSKELLIMECIKCPYKIQHDPEEYSRKDAQEAIKKNCYCRKREKEEEEKKAKEEEKERKKEAVSYTHLTLPTKRIV